MAFYRPRFLLGARGLLAAASLSSLGAVLAIGCEDETIDSTPEPEGPAYVIDVVVDANRDGLLDAGDATEDEEIWDAEHGAMILPNLDDDDEDGIRDADDLVINAGADSFDVVAFRVSACKECPAGSVGKLELDAVSAGRVRVFQLDQAAGVWNLIAGETAVCSVADATCAPQPVAQIADVQKGGLFAIEARDVVRDASWTGFVDLAYSIADEKGKPLTSEDNPDGVDRARLRVAPWQLFGNLSPFDTVWSDAGSGVFVVGIKEATTDAGITYERYHNYDDQWTQDFFQTGYFAITIAGPDGAPVVHGMRVANARPWGRDNDDDQLPITWLNKNYLGPDRATLVVYDEPHSGDSYDSHGNHDLLPAYENGDDKFPLGRIIIGSGVLDETQEFYNAQGTQAPIYVANSSWLYVGHVDEFLSYVPASTPRGWKLLIASPRLAREMLLDAQDAGHGAVLMHEGKYWYEEQGSGTYAAAITIDEVLADEALLEASEDAQSYIDEEVDKLKEEIGLSDDDVIEMPFLFNEIGGNYKIAYQPGTVNALVFGDYIVMAKPFGPQIDGEDIFEADLEARLGSATNGLGKDGEGMQVYFTDDWDTYHRLDGEVHCGSNPEAPAPFSSVNWWETGR